MSSITENYFKQNLFMNNNMDYFFSPTPFNAKTDNKQQPKKQDKQTNSLIQCCLSSGPTVM